MSYLRGLASAQRMLQSRIDGAIPSADIRWHYSIVLDAIAVELPRADVGRLRGLPGVARVYPSVRYHALGSSAPLLDQTPELIGAPDLWGPSLETAGNGLKIGVIDDGLDQTHPFFNPTGYSMPPGFPKGNTAYTSNKVIVARAFAPATPKYGNADKPFDPQLSAHATHVAGIAAGDNNTRANGAFVSGIAPKAYLGNYKVLTIPTPRVGPDGNGPEIAKGIEAAVADGMDVINLSLGEPEVEPSRDIVVKAIDGAAAAGVVPALAAGNDFDSFGRGSVGSPGSAPRAITAAAATNNRVIAGFSSGGPTPVSLQMKPDVSAPGVGVLSSVPGGWDSWSGTSMASPHVAGAAALLRQRHPNWSVEQIKSALVLTGTPVYTGSGHTTEVPSTREGGGFISLPAANEPLIFAQPTGLSFGFLHPGSSASRSVQITDAGGGAGGWSVSVTQRGPASVTVPASLSVPGSLAVRASAASGAADGEVTGFVVLTKGSTTRRIPFWLRVTSPRLPHATHKTLTKAGTYNGNTKGRAALVDTYRYPDAPSGAGVPTELRGPEQVYTFRLARPVANFGVAVIGHGPGVSIQPRVVAENDENRLTGYPALPVNLNPYTLCFLSCHELAAGAILPAAGRYDIVFDSTSGANAGAFTFRFWIGDTKRPTARLLTRTTTRTGVLRFKVTDGGAGVDPQTVAAAIDGRAVTASYSRAKGIVAIPFGRSTTLARGAHKVILQVSDYQESRNMEDVGPILPNTRTLSTTFRVR